MICVTCLQLFLCFCVAGKHEPIVSLINRIYIFRQKSTTGCERKRSAYTLGMEKEPVHCSKSKFEEKFKGGQLGTRHQLN